MFSRAFARVVCGASSPTRHFSAHSAATSTTGPPLSLSLLNALQNRSPHVRCFTSDPHLDFVVKTSEFFETNDGVRLHYLDAKPRNQQTRGEATTHTLVLLPGWSQTAIQFEETLRGLSARGLRVLAIDHRGHGQSARPSHGYRVERLATDVRCFLTDLDLTEVVLAGHAFGASVIWSYFSLFGADRLQKIVVIADRLQKIVVIDQPPALLRNPYWNQTECELTGAAFDVIDLHGVPRSLAGPDGVAFTKQMLKDSLLPGAPQAQLDWFLEQNLLLPRVAAAQLIASNMAIDWRETIKRIDVPALVVTGKKSIVPRKSQEWMSQAFPRGQFELMEGSHFMFYEHPAIFNDILFKFITA
eukprot:g49710.t1